MSDHETTADKSAAMDVQTDNTGAELAEFGPVVASGDLKPRALRDDVVDLEVNAEYLGDEPSWVHLSTTVDGVDVQLALRPSEADRLGAKLRSAAAFVKREESTQ